MSLLPGNFQARVAAFAEWRKQVGVSVRRYEQWLTDNGLGDPSLKARLDLIKQRLLDERMSVAVVAEYSRGKSELINALFFAGYGKRILPSSAGRTTMCPTELMYDAARAPSIRLLPIETRLRDTSLADLRESDEDWTEIAIDPADVNSVSSAFESVRQMQSVSVDSAVLLGLYDAEDPDSPVRPDHLGQIEVPRWRHAIVNIPDPLLEQGLVIIDTPGLNAIGSEPELTLNLIPSANAVLFVLAADAGVTRTDIEVWRENISSKHSSGRYVVLNKIDGLWDDLRSPAEIDAEIASQVNSVAQTLSLPAERIFPVSAQKGLSAKVHQDAALLARSRLPELEHALSNELVPQQREVMREHVQRDFNELHAVTHSVLQARRRNHVEQLFELNSLRGKNRNVVDVMANRIQGERAEFEKSLRHLQALRSVFVRHSQTAYATVAMDGLKRHVRTAREVMRTSTFSMGLRDGMSSLLSGVRSDFDELRRQSEEIGTMMTAMYKTFNVEHGFSLGSPMLFSVLRFETELENIETLYRSQFGAFSLLTTERRALMKRFFESVAARVKEVYVVAHRELEVWLRAVMSPIEGQVREHQVQLRRRLESVRRVLDASGTLEDRIAEIEQSRSTVEAQQSVVGELATHVRVLVSRDIDQILPALVESAADVNLDPTAALVPVVDKVDANDDAAQVPAVADFDLTDVASSPLGVALLAPSTSVRSSVDTRAGQPRAVATSGVDGTASSALDAALDSALDSAIDSAIDSAFDSAFDSSSARSSMTAPELDPALESELDRMIDDAVENPITA